jgi:hypothetical protein
MLRVLDFDTPSDVGDPTFGLLTPKHTLGDLGLLRVEYPCLEYEMSRSSDFDDMILILFSPTGTSRHLDLVKVEFPLWEGGNLSPSHDFYDKIIDFS